MIYLHEWDRYKLYGFSAQLMRIETIPIPELLKGTKAFQSVVQVPAAPSILSRFSSIVTMMGFACTSYLMGCDSHIVEPY